MFRVADREGNLRDSFTYEETNAWANRVANGLIKKYKIKKGDRVGIYMLNSAEYVISIIAVHKAGAVQVPINKDEKGERLLKLIETLNEHDDVQNVFANFEVSDALMAKLGA